MANRVLEFLGEDDGKPKGRKRKEKKAEEPPIPQIDRSTPEYEAGKTAFASGIEEDDNPYPKGGNTGGQRMSWFSGYFDARTSKRLGPAFDRNGITFP